MRNLRLFAFLFLSCLSLTACGDGSDDAIQHLNAQEHCYAHYSLTCLRMLECGFGATIGVETEEDCASEAADVIGCNTTTDENYCGEGSFAPEVATTCRETVESVACEGLLDVLLAGACNEMCTTAVE